MMSPHSARTPAAVSRSSSSLRITRARKEQNRCPAIAASDWSLCANDDKTNASWKFTLEGAGERLVAMPNPDAQTPAAAGSGTPEGRRPTVVPAPAAANPELSERPRRRTFTAQEKLHILQEADRATGAGKVGALLRREGLYSSHLTDWRRQRDAGILTGLTPARRGPKPSEPNPMVKDLAKAQQEIARLKLRLERAEAIIDLQKKVSDLLGMKLPPTESDAEP